MKRPKRWKRFKILLCQTKMSPTEKEKNCTIYLNQQYYLRQIVTHIYTLINGIISQKICVGIIS